MRHTVTINGETYGTYASRDEAQRIADGLRRVWWATTTRVEVKRV